MSGIVEPTHGDYHNRCITRTATSILTHLIPQEGFTVHTQILDGDLFLKEA